MFPKYISDPCVQAPFLDVLGTMEDPSLPLTLEDRDEWGDPIKHPQHRLSISSYCPVHNITPQVRKLTPLKVSVRLCKQLASIRPREVGFISLHVDCFVIP